MPGAYIMINTLPGMEKPLLDEIAQVPGVVSVEGVYGEFDLIVRVEVPPGNAVDFVINEIRKIQGIKSTGLFHQSMASAEVVLEWTISDHHQIRNICFYW